MNKYTSFDDLCEAFFTAYIREFGERKFKTVVDKIMTSNKVSGLISTSRYQMVRPGAKTFLSCLHEISYFMFARNETMALAGLLAVTRWNGEANLFSAMADDARLLDMAKVILTELRCTNF